MQLMTFGFFTILGSALNIPETSVQFSYKSALTDRAIIEPVTSDPPLEKVLMLPSGIAP